MAHMLSIIMDFTTLQENLTVSIVYRHVASFTFEFQPCCAQCLNFEPCYLVLVLLSLFVASYYYDTRDDWGFARLIFSFDSLPEESTETCFGKVIYRGLQKFICYSVCWGAPSHFLMQSPTYISKVRKEEQTQNENQSPRSPMWCLLAIYIKST